MKANENDILGRLIVLPKTFNAVGTISMNALLKETGYCEFHDLFSETAIADALSLNPEIINDWLEYSEDKRTSSGWYIKRGKKGAFIVGKVEMIENSEMTYTDKIKACAAFIKREVETIRQG